MNETGIVLLVEDDKAILRTNRRILEQEGFTVLCAETLAEARRHLETHKPDVYVLDIMLPDGSGLDFCAEIRDGTTAPMLFLTALDARHEVIQGLVAGGNDYITKPYDIDVFVEKVKAQYRQFRKVKQESANEQVITRGPITLDVVSARAYQRGTDMLLSPKEFALLLVLATREGETLTAQYLYKKVWKQPMDEDSQALRSTMLRLRKKLEDTGCAIDFVRGGGYAFIYK